MCQTEERGRSLRKYSMAMLSKDSDFVAVQKANRFKGKAKEPKKQNGKGCSSLAVAPGSA